MGINESKIHTVAPPSVLLLFLAWMVATRCLLARMKTHNCAIKMSLCLQSGNPARRSLIAESPPTLMITAHVRHILLNRDGAPMEKRSFFFPLSLIHSRSFNNCKLHINCMLFPPKCNKTRRMKGLFE